MPLDRINSHKIYLASNSPRRKKLLSDLGIDFEVITGNKVDETINSDIDPKIAAEYLALKKNRAYQHLHTENSILITADTTVLLVGEIMDKPKDTQEAEDILMMLSNNRHEVRTGVCISTQDKEISFTETSKVWFNALTQEEIRHYIRHFKPFDKAGGYGIQEWIGLIGIKRIEGTYENIVGLPVQKVWQELKNLI